MKRKVKAKKKKVTPADLEEARKRGGLIAMIELFPKPKLPKGDLRDIFYEDWGRRNAH